LAKYAYKDDHFESVAIPQTGIFNGKTSHKSELKLNKVIIAYKSNINKQELPMVAMFVFQSEPNEKTIQYLP
jgi:hypothetical protein